MKSIGQSLKDRRIELGYSIDEIYEKTKLSPIHIKAIENGDLDYFKHDLSYLKFFIQYYCQAVYMDFDDIKDDLNRVLDDYNETQLIKKQESHQASNENIQRRIQSNQKKYKSAKGSTSIKFKKIDTQTLIVVMVVVLIIAMLIFGFFKFVLPNLSSGSPSNPDNNGGIILPVDPEPEEPEPEPQPDTQPDPDPEPEEPSFTIVEQTYDNYLISSNDKTSLKLIVEFSLDTWIQAYVNDTSVEVPVPQTYGPGTSIEIQVEQTTDKITIHFGNLAGSTIYINDELVNLNEQALLNSTGLKINFFFEGD